MTKPETRLQSFTKKGPGRVHVYGPGPRKRWLATGDRNKSAWLPDSLDAKWKLSPTQRRERERHNQGKKPA
jgi:hypothetical protein